ncbi:hypothetical protein HDU85_001133 [Gaertneriomyces sp. JEL0708]|nr:hypothetical protein HDU85_001133 [Gaertneriomyces sp. JEL0708]
MALFSAAFKNPAMSMLVALTAAFGAYGTYVTFQGGRAPAVTELGKRQQEGDTGIPNAGSGFGGEARTGQPPRSTLQK